MTAETICGEPPLIPDSAWLHIEHGSQTGFALSSARFLITPPPASAACAHSSTAPKRAPGRQSGAHATVWRGAARACAPTTD